MLVLTSTRMSIEFMFFFKFLSYISLIFKNTMSNVYFSVSFFRYMCMHINISNWVSWVKYKIYENISFTHSNSVMELNSLTWLHTWLFCITGIYLFIYSFIRPGITFPDGISFIRTTLDREKTRYSKLFTLVLVKLRKYTFCLEN